MKTPTLLAALLCALVLACSSVSRTDGDPPAPSASGDSAAEEPETLSGVLVPATCEPVALWPEAYAGELLVLEAQPRGSLVSEGDVLVRLDSRTVDEQVRKAELEVRSKEVQHEGLLEKNEIAEEGAHAVLRQARASLDRAQRALAGFQEHEQAFAARLDELSRRRDAQRVDDQKDELAQLEAMYEADELTDATEEIVLKRSRRDLALTELRNALAEDQRRYGDELTEELDAEARVERVAKETLTLEHLVRTQAVEARAREDAEARSASDLDRKRTHLQRLQRDRELFELRAPRSGMLLHGAARAYRPGGSPPRIERGGTLSARADVLLVSDPDALSVAVDVPESALEAFPSGARVLVTPVARPELELRGSLVLEDHPAAAKNGEAAFEGLVELEDVPSELVVGMHVTLMREPQE